ncbi:MAG TPA: L-threonylcarbamoyladenylate synthase [Paludibacter sp.]|nr:L-threonylcarbamoyladenylate synthase [Paludibacter sp.]
MDNSNQSQSEINREISNAFNVLIKGGVILYPTDTVWGLGCDATNEDAVKRIFEIKKRTDTKAMLVLIDNPAKLQGYVNEIPEMAWDLIELSEKPLTIIYPEAKNLAKNLVSNDKTIGIRVTNELFSKKLCERFRKAIVSTSANVSGEKTPATFKEITEEIKSSVDYVVNFRQNESTLPKPSSIIKLGIGNVIQIIRE